MSAIADYPVISYDPAVQEHYERCRAEGTSHSLAVMFALGVPPMSNSDREFLEGTGRQFEDTPYLGDRYAAVARRHGLNITGKTYLSGLARFPGDPRAWVSGRGDVQRICEQEGWGCQGAVNTPLRLPDKEPEQVGVAPDLLERCTDIAISENPDLAHRPRDEVKAEVYDQVKPHWAK